MVPAGADGATLIRLSGPNCTGTPPANRVDGGAAVAA
jgi:hypothetical protein